jgi:hypothetical protein
MGGPNFRQQTKFTEPRKNQEIFTKLSGFLLIIIFMILFDQFITIKRIKR